MRTHLDRAQARISELENQQCAQVSDFDRQVSEAEAEIERLRADGSGSRPSTPRESETHMHVDSSTVHVRPTTVPSSSRRRDKVPPVEPLNCESEAMRLEDWLPALERAAT